ncbi:phage-related holin [Bacillus niacini]|uniref:Phage-related holin n=1 Tax=Neobacillus niacini TaxID=86668 RepID=A0A852T8M0_9BACI|nr:phage holin family protein [Neobacillus niacini]NYE03868.1 phage-related holin [Neobacillus niacini]
MIIDYVSGLLASGVEGKLSSKVGIKGLHKLKKHLSTFQNTHTLPVGTKQCRRY